jgi:hypothetical protein
VVSSLMIHHLPERCAPRRSARRCVCYAPGAGCSSPTSGRPQAESA